METLKDIFVTYDIAVQLKEIGFDEPCIAYQWYSDLEEDRKHLTPATNGMFVLGDLLFEPVDYSNPNILPRPTWEQVKKWFRDKGVVGYLFYFENSDTWVFHIKDDNGLKETSDLKYETYEQAREQLILKLIEVYKNGK